MVPVSYYHGGLTHDLLSDINIYTYVYLYILLINTKYFLWETPQWNCKYFVTFQKSIL